MISAAGIKDQDLTIIVSMMLIELALSRLSRAVFKRLALLDTQGLELLVALLPRVWWARRDPAPPASMFRWIVMIDGRKRGAISLIGVLRQVRSSSPPSA
jgi:hypothetical protein